MLQIAIVWLCLAIDVFINVRHTEGTCAFVGSLILTEPGLAGNFPWFLRGHLLLVGSGNGRHL